MATQSIFWCNRDVIDALQSGSFAGFYADKENRRCASSTDRLRSYSAAMRTSFCNVAHTTERYANNRMEASHQPTRQRERQMRRFKSTVQAQRFLSLHGVLHNLFRLGRHLIRSQNYRFLRSRSFSVWRTVTAR
jgi:putative transposase